MVVEGKGWGGGGGGRLVNCARYSLKHGMDFVSLGGG